MINFTNEKTIKSVVPECEVWILTFNRPDALNRLVENFGKQGMTVNIFSNYPELNLRPDLREQYVNQLIFNTLNSKESSSWCARSWNTIMMKAFENPNVTEAILIQDDTNIGPDFVSWFKLQRRHYSFIWGPAGDQFHFLRKNILQQTGWWDERYIGCYCGDADYVKRVYFTSNTSYISVTDSHNWGFNINDCGLANHVITEYQSKLIGGNYENQHWQFESIDKENPTIRASQQHFREKWGVELDNNEPVINSYERKLNEIDWYPWFSKKHEIETHNGIK